MRIAYADPPYLGCGKQHYGKLHADAAAYDTLEAHSALIKRLHSEFPDGWALSLNSNTLEEMLHLCRAIVGPNAVRVGAWTKPFASFKPNVTPAFAWEPVIFRGGRRRTREEWSGRDWVAAMPPAFIGEHSVPGSKPDLFCFWLFNDVFGLRQGDELVDLFPGSGAAARAWDSYQRQARLPSIVRNAHKQREILLDLGASEHVMNAHDRATELLSDRASGGEAEGDHNI